MNIRIVDTIEEFKRYFQLKHEGVILEEGLDIIETETDLFDRKQRDAEVLCTLAANCSGKILDIGTSLGHSAYKLATNIGTNGRVFTVNMLPEQTDEKEKLITHVLSLEEIGSFYRSKGITNIEQMYANTLEWAVPDVLRDLALVFVDGGHDSRVVYSDSRLFYERIMENGFLLWHDFSPLFRHKFGWINEVMLGVEKFVNDFGIEGEIVNLRNSWIGVYRKKPKQVIQVADLRGPEQHTESPSLQEFTVPSELKSLRYLLAYTAHDAARLAEEERHCARLRNAGYDIEGFCVSVPSPGNAWPFPQLDREWSAKSPPLMAMYENLADKLRGKDVLVLWTGAMIHPDFLKTLPTYNVYVCSDDPESSTVLSMPVAPHFDYAFTRNIACVDDYRKWGCRYAKWLCPAFDPEFSDPHLTAEQILTGDRTIDIVMFCERVYGFSDRAQRIERLHNEFPAAHIRGKGWPGGYVSQTDIVAAYKNAKIGWNLHNSIGPTNSRLTALPAFGIMEICDNKSQLAKVFALDKEIVGFESIEECIDKTRYYLAHDRERREIAARGWQRVTTDFTELREWERVLSSIAPTLLAKRRVLNTPELKIAPVHRPNKLHLGCGAEYLPGYVNIDSDPAAKADLYMNIMEIDRHFAARSVDEILMIHSLNYLNLWQARDFFRKAATLLSPGGTLIIETPNLIKAVDKIKTNYGMDTDEYLEGVRALHAFGMDQIERREIFTPYAFSWSPQHLEAELRQAGFVDVSVLPPETHAPWRDMRIEARVGNAALSAVKSRSLLIIADSAMGHATLKVRGSTLTESLQARGCRVDFVDVRQSRAKEIVAKAGTADVVYLLKVAQLDLVRRLKETGANVVFDLSDALWTEFHQRHGWQDLDAILGTVDGIISDNAYVAKYGQRFSANVHVVPTATYVERFAEKIARQAAKPADAPITLGWLGSQGTAGGLQTLRGCLELVAARHSNLELRVVGADQTAVPEFANLPTSFVPTYDEERMIDEVVNFDIGLFPPPLDLDDYIVRGGLKAMIYMSGGVPALCYRAGECADLIEDGVTGMLAESNAEWEAKLEQLIASPQLRRTIGEKGRAAVAQTHSLAQVSDTLLTTFDRIISQKRPAPHQDAPSRADSLAQKAGESIDKGSYQEATTLLAEALKLDPTNAMARYYSVLVKKLAMTRGGQ